MMTMPNGGVQIRIADGGYIVQWMESQKPSSDEPPSYLENERHALSNCLPSQRFAPVRLKCTVRVTLQEALKLAGDVLGRLQKAGIEDDYSDFGGAA